MKRRPDYILREVADTTVIIPVGKAAVEFPGMISVNEMGKQIWELLREERTEDEIVAWICARYETDLQQARADTAAFLRRLELAGALCGGEERSP